MHSRIYWYVMHHSSACDMLTFWGRLRYMNCNAGNVKLLPLPGELKRPAGGGSSAGQNEALLDRMIGHELFNP